MADLPITIKVHNEVIELEPFIKQWYKKDYAFPRTSDCEECDLEVHMEEHGVEVGDLAKMNFETKKKLHGALHERDRKPSFH